MFIAPNEIGDLEKYLEKYHIDTFEDLNQVLEEHQQILDFFPWVKRLQGQVEAEQLELVFHIFCDAIDDFLTDPAQALELYLQHRAHGEPNVRLSYELYSDRENDVVEEEDVMIGFGGFPS